MFWKVIILLFLVIILTYAAARGIGALLAGILPEFSVYILQYRWLIVLAAILIYILSKIKKRKAAIVYIIITAIMFANSAVGFFVEKRDWIVTAAIVENIDWTEETYFGSYISKSGEIRENVEFCPFYGSPYGIFDFAYKPLVNNEILIHYDPSTVSVYPEYDYFVLCDSEIYFSEMADLILSAVLFVASLVFLVLNIKPKVSKTDAQSGSNDKIQSSAIDSADIINN